MSLPPTVLPSWDNVRSHAHVVELRLATRFRGITTREAVVFRLQHGWVEFAPFADYEDIVAASWLAAAFDAGMNGLPKTLRDAVPVNATVPALAPDRVSEAMQKFPGAQVAKIKVAEAGHSVQDDLNRVEAVLGQLGKSGRVRLDANGGWDVATAIKVIDALSGMPVEYLEQPCRTVPELAEVRRHALESGSQVRIAADESIRLASDPHRVAEAQAADVAVVKVPPLAGPRRVLALAADLKRRYDMDVVYSSALDTAIGMTVGVSVAAAAPELRFACGLATSRLFLDDIAAAPVYRDGMLEAPTGLATPDPQALEEFQASPERCAWWFERLERCYRILQENNGNPPALPDGVPGGAS